MCTDLKPLINRKSVVPFLSIEIFVHTHTHAEETHTHTHRKTDTDAHTLTQRKTDTDAGTTTAADRASHTYDFEAALHKAQFASRLIGVAMAII